MEGVSQHPLVFDRITETHRNAAEIPAAASR
jgi:hypothetical protein